MKKFLYLSAVLLLTAWLVGVLVYAVGAVVHLLLLSSVMLILLLSHLDKKVPRNI